MWKNDELSSEDKQKFDAYRFTEIDNLLKLNAHSVMTIKDSEHFAKTTPENMIPTNVLDNSNLQDDGTLKAKSRCVLMGWKDPMKNQLARAALAPTQEAIMVTLQWLASAKVSGRVADPTDSAEPSLVETEIYGLVSGPAGLTVDVLAAGYVKNPYDRCLFTISPTKTLRKGKC